MKNWNCPREEYSVYEMAKTTALQQKALGYETRILYRERGVFQIKTYKEETE